MPFLVCLLVFHSFAVNAGLLLTYHQLALKDLDAMTRLVQTKVKESKKSVDEKTLPLKEAYQAVFSRPDEDGLIEKIVGPLRNELEDLDVKEQVVESLVNEAVDALSKPKNIKPDVQVTYWIFLENSISDFKQAISTASEPQGTFEMKMLQKIAKTKLEISTKAKQERTLRMMKSTVSPSDVSAKILQTFESKIKKEEKK